MLARIPRAELESLLLGYDHQPYFVEGADPEQMHHQMAATMDRILHQIGDIQRRAREDGLIWVIAHRMFLLYTRTRRWNI